MAKPKGEMSADELTLKEAEEFALGPLSVLTSAVKGNSQVLVALRNNKKMLGRVKAFDRHGNMVLEGAKLLWSEAPKTGKGKKKTKLIARDRYIGKVFLRGDSIVVVVKNPLAVRTIV